MYKVLFVEPEENFKKILFFSNEFNIRRKYPIFLFAATWLAISTKYEIGSHVCFPKLSSKKKGHVGGKKLQKIAIFHKYVLVALRQISN